MSTGGERGERGGGERGERGGGEGERGERGGGGEGRKDAVGGDGNTNKEHYCNTILQTAEVMVCVCVGVCRVADANHLTIR